MDNPDYGRRSGPSRDVTVVGAVHRTELLPEDDLRPRYPSERLGGDEFQEDGGANILHYLSIVLKRRWLIIGFALAFLLGGVVLTFLQTPIYRAVATIQIDLAAATVVEVKGVEAVETNSNSFYATQYEQLKSRALASRVVADLNLTEDARFLRAAPPSVLAKVRDLLFNEPTRTQEAGQPNPEEPQLPAGEAASTSAVDATPAQSENAIVGRLTAAAKRAWGGIAFAWGRLGNLVYKISAPEVGPEDLGVEQRRAIAVGRLLGGLSVQPIGTSRVVRLIYESPVPRVAAQVANAYAKAFINTNLDRRYDASSYARTFLEERLQEIKLKLEESEKQLVNYARQQGIVDINDQAASLVASEYADARQTYANATAERLRAEELWRQVEATSGLGIAEIRDNPTIAKLREERARVAAEYQQKLSYLRPNYPEMQELEGRITGLDRLIQGEADLIKTALKSAYQAALAKEKALEETLTAIETKVSDFQDRNIRYKILLREVDTNNVLYQGLLQRYKEIGVTGGVGTNNISIIDLALAPGSPFEPNVPKNLALALMLGLVVGVGAAFALDIFDDALKSAEEVEQELGVVVIGILPLVTSPKVGRFVSDNPRSGLAEAFRSLRTALQFATANGAPRSLLITSPRSAEGKSTISVSVARSFAKIGMRVLLIDGDLRDPSLDNELRQDGSAELAVSPGLTDYLTGAASSAEVFHPTEVENLFYVPTGPLPPNPAELLAGPKLPQLLRTAEEEFDIVVIDGPPIIGLADAPLLSSVSGETLLVIAANQSRRGVTKAALKRLELARARVLGVVLNKFDYRKVGFSYDYGYGYGYGYGYDYGSNHDKHYSHGGSRLASGEEGKRG